MSLDPDPIFNAVESHAKALGHFERVNTHEPLNRPGNGLTCAIWVQRITPVPRHSGLAATSARMLLNARIYSPMLQQPQDAIDPNVVRATADLMSAYSGDFQLGDNAAYIDLLGIHGVALDAVAGYLPQSQERIMTIALPVILNDVFTQEA